MFKLVSLCLMGLMLFSVSACSDDDVVTTPTKIEINEFIDNQEEQPKIIILEKRYCYKAQADILCYDTPQIDKHDQFIGEQ